MHIESDIVRFASIECRLQMSGELSVYWMIEAWLYAQSVADRTPTVEDVLLLGKLVEPNVNLGFRTVSVRVGADVKIPWKEVPEATANLMGHQDSLTPAEFFKAYEDVHPFRDGNGRSGVLLYNWLQGTLNSPNWPPNFWNDPRRTVGFGA